jgi:hypothetical protein
MNNFTPYEKLSKKERRKRNAEKRTVWTISPVTRRPANPKAYNRKKAQKWSDDSSVSVSFFFTKRESPAERRFRVIDKKNKEG